MISKIKVGFFLNGVGDACEILVKNMNTGKKDTWRLVISEEGTTYHILLAKQTPDREQGVFAARELIETIGDHNESN